MKSALSAFLTACALSLAAPAASAAPAADAWSAFLSRYVDTSAADGINRVRYTAVTEADAKALQAWIRSRQREKPSALPGKARMAWWIDFYNAGTVSLLLASRPSKSILEVDLSGPGKQGPWDARLYTVEGKELSLNDIENRILRPTFKDPRIHFALNCASLGCPELQPLPWSADLARLGPRLDRATRDFLASPQGIAFQGGVLRLSSLFDWYKEDFGATDPERRAWLASHADSATATRLRSHAGKVEYGYDWSLNAAPPRAF